MNSFLTFLYIAGLAQPVQFIPVELDINKTGLP